MNNPAFSRRPADYMTDAFRNKMVLITGGMGFIGSSLAIRLAGYGAKVLIVDAMLDPYGGNLFNISTVRDLVKVNFCDIRDSNVMNYLVRGQDYIFHCAAQVCHLMSLENPFEDIDINIKGAAVLMEAMRKHNRGAVLVKMGSRGQYGSVVNLPADEDMSSDPKGIYEISLLSSEQITRSYCRIHGIKSVMLRLTNIYGPRAQMKHNRFGVANWLVRLAIDGKPVTVYGDGLIKRDFLYIDDCVDAILLSAICEKSYGEVFNVGRDDPSTFLELAETIVGELGSGEIVHVPFSPERKAQEPGDFYSNITKIRKYTGWTPKVNLREGVAAAISYYLKHRKEYW